MNKLDLSCLVVVLFVLIFLSVAAFAAEFHWGGTGYDPALKTENLSSRFVARPHQQDPSLVEILIDAEITVKGTTLMELAPKRGAVLKSDMCWKALKHFASPWACSFPKQDIDKLTGIGQVRVKDKKGRVLLKDTIDFDAVKRGLNNRPSRPER